MALIFLSTLWTKSPARGRRETASLCHADWGCTWNGADCCCFGQECWAATEWPFFWGFWCPGWIYSIVLCLILLSSGLAYPSPLQECI